MKCHIAEGVQPRLVNLFIVMEIRWIHVTEALGLVKNRRFHQLQTGIRILSVIPVFKS